MAHLRWHTSELCFKYKEFLIKFILLNRRIKMSIMLISLEVWFDGCLSLTLQVKEMG